MAQHALWGENVSCDTLVGCRFVVLCLILLWATLCRHSSQKQFEQVVKRLAKHHKAHRSSLPTMIWRDASVQHFRMGGATGKQRLPVSMWV
jgi:hypothetical protein